VVGITEESPLILTVLPPTFQVSQEACRRLLLRFIEATHSPDHEARVNMLSEEATLISDSGGGVRAALNVIHSSDRIARLLIGILS
jgi:hypothetical protein